MISDMGRGVTFGMVCSFRKPCTPVISFIYAEGSKAPLSSPGSTWKHEDASEMMFDDLVEEYNINLSADEVLFIKALIAGNKDARCE